MTSSSSTTVIFLLLSLYGSGLKLLLARLLNSLNQMANGLLVTLNKNNTNNNEAVRGCLLHSYDFVPDLYANCIIRCVSNCQATVSTKAVQ
jgi:hypothetical protein